jgi:outer membrane protein, multidrug efflux system
MSRWIVALAVLALAAAPAAAQEDAAAPIAPAVDHAAPRADWWAALGDPLLDRLVAHAVRSNRDILAAEADARRARALARVEGWNLAPFGGVGLGGGRERVGAEDRENNFVSVDGDLSWELDVFGRLRAGAAAARAEAISFEEARRGAMSAIAARTAATYIDLRGAQARLAAAQANAKAQAQTLRLTEALKAGGRGTPLDVARARSQLESTQAAIPLLRAQIDGDVAALDVLVAGLTPDLAAALRAPGPRLVPPPSVAVGQPDDLLRRRPDIRQAEARLHAAQARVRAARVDWWPRISFVGAASAVGLNFGALDSNRAFSFTLGPRIDWPALDFRRNALRTEAAKAGAEAEFHRYEKLVLAGARDLDAALASLGGALAAESRQEAAAEAARQAADMSRIRYREGVDPFLAVLDAERRLAEAEDAFALARTRSALAYVRVGEALGVGWTDAAPAPT